MSLAQPAPRHLSALPVPHDPGSVEIIFAKALLCGLIFFAFWACRLDLLATFLSYSWLVGRIRELLRVSVEADGGFCHVRADR